MDSTRTPFPATLATKTMHSNRETSQHMSLQHAQQLSNLHTVGALKEPLLTDVILVDHRNTLTMLTQFFKIAEINIQAASLVAIALALDLRLHQHAEFVVLYPLLEQVDKESGSLLVKHNLQEHKDLDSQLDELLDIVSSLNFSRLVPLVQKIEELFIAHQAEEELQVLPRLAKGLSTKELVEAGAQFIAAKQHADLKLA